MNPDHAHFAEWDAAYVVGALSSAERLRFEDHLAACPECRRAVAELSPTIGLLSRVSPERAASIDAALADGQVDQDGPDSSVRAEVVSLGERRALRRRRTWWLAAAAAVVLVVAAIAIPVTLSRTAPTASFALEAVVDVPLEADVRLSSVGWGTRIDLDCRYTPASDAEVPAEGWPYALAVVDADGESTNVSTWQARPGATARLSAGTALSIAEISAVEIRSVDSGRLLMRYELDG
ncbi:MAG TPA: zf-HC2 domain-containing protein [Microbacterium sp.]|nr:zf-HC2 domain-containing protein [Microbacterium sp.]